MALRGNSKKLKYQLNNSAILKHSVCHLKSNCVQLYPDIDNTLFFDHHAMFG